MIHIHPLYEAWFCGEHSGVYCTDDRHVDCPKCRSRIDHKEVKPMQMDHFISEYKQWHEKCGHVVNADTCLLKLYEECLELIAAIESGDHDAIVSERLDVLNTAIFSTYMDGQADVLYFGRMKLEQNLERYKKEGKI